MKSLQVKLYFLFSFLSFLFSNALCSSFALTSWDSGAENTYPFTPASSSSSSFPPAPFSSFITLPPTVPPPIYCSSSIPLSFFFSFHPIFHLSPSFPSLILPLFIPSLLFYSIISFHLLFSSFLRFSCSLFLHSFLFLLFPFPSSTWLGLHVSLLPSSASLPIFVFPPLIIILPFLSLPRLAPSPLPPDSSLFMHIEPFLFHVISFSSFSVSTSLSFSNLFFLSCNKKTHIFPHLFQPSLFPHPLLQLT